MTSGSSFTPLRSTVWQPSGIPASASMPSAVTAAGVSSSGWLKCVLMYSGWYLLRIAHSSGVTRSGRWQGIRLQMRNRPQPLADLVDPAVREQQGIAARHDHIADLAMLLEVAERRFELRHRDLLGVADFAPAGAEAAIRGADR